MKNKSDAGMPDKALIANAALERVEYSKCACGRSYPLGSVGTDGVTIYPHNKKQCVPCRRVGAVAS